jgi:hypothetical protein
VNGLEETISQYICDWPDCPEVAVHLIAVIPALRLRAMVCREHAARIANRTDR